MLAVCGLIGLMMLLSVNTESEQMIRFCSSYVSGLVYSYIVILTMVYFCIYICIKP